MVNNVSGKQRRAVTAEWSIEYKMITMGLLPDTQNCGLRMRRECRERFPRHRLQRKPIGSDPGMHHGTCVTHMPWCMSGSLNPRRRGKLSRHSRRMRNPQVCISGKRPMNRHRGTACVYDWVSSNTDDFTKCGKLYLITLLVNTKPFFRHAECP